MYDYCSMSNFDDTNIGTIYYDDNQGGCEEEASQTMLLEAGVTYWIRWLFCRRMHGGMELASHICGGSTGMH